MNHELQTINFHQDTIFVVDHNGEPFVPLKPICENIGLAWQPQHEKLNAQKERLTVMQIVTVAADGKQRKMVCIHLRKFFTWLNTIRPGKVAPNLKAKIEMYQNECDEVLWNYWTKGKATAGMDSNSAIDAMVGQVIRMVVPAVTREVMESVLGQVSPMVDGINNRLGSLQINFSHYGTVWSFTSCCCKEGGHNTFTPKDVLYKAYVLYCTAMDCHPESKPAFCSKIYTAIVNAGSAVITIDGKKTPVIRGLALLPGYQVIIGDYRRRQEEKDARLLAERRRYLFDIDEEQTVDDLEVQ